MKKIIKTGLLMFAIGAFYTACNNNDGSSVSKGDPAIVHGSDSSSSSTTAPTSNTPSSGQANGNSNSSNTPSPAASTPDSGSSKGKDSSKMKSKKP